MQSWKPSRRQPKEGNCRGSRTRCCGIYPRAPLAVKQLGSLGRDPVRDEPRSQSAYCAYAYVGRNEPQCMSIAYESPSKVGAMYTSHVAPDEDELSFHLQPGERREWWESNAWTDNASSVALVNGSIFHHQRNRLPFGTNFVCPGSYQYQGREYENTRSPAAEWRLEAKAREVERLAGPAVERPTYTTPTRVLRRDDPGASALEPASVSTPGISQAADPDLRLSEPAVMMAHSPSESPAAEVTADPPDCVSAGGASTSDVLAREDLSRCSRMLNPSATEISWKDLNSGSELIQPSQVEPPPGGNPVGSIHLGNKSLQFTKGRSYPKGEVRNQVHSETQPEPWIVGDTMGKTTRHLAQHGMVNQDSGSFAWPQIQVRRIYSCDRAQKKAVEARGIQRIQLVF
ncbi:unnamed protein product [Phytophthora lilii]|uniref:Unnamed protein product n=1 Tax=Phytophthora lilii TaxID=2077276 RepID=A0A9W6TQQ8_9STRA|nr:unnamed protein product [Phytophthora lilii]